MPEPYATLRATASSPAVEYRLHDWYEQFQASRSGVAKRIAYALMRPFLDFEARRLLTKNALRTYSPTLVLRERGFPIETRRRWALARIDVKHSVILVQGTGSGWDVLTWARFRPKRIIATDLFSFDSWEEVSRYCRNRWNVTCEFRQAPLEDHAFLQEGSVDACVSDMVFEHCRNLPAVLAETHRVLKPGGRLYAAYGPLWYCGGGDHYSARNGLDSICNHLLLAPSEYRKFVEAIRRDEEEFQNGYRYIELDLFSRLTTASYLDAFRHARFRVDDVILELSCPSLRFRKTHPRLYRQLLDRTAGCCSPDDLIIKGNLVRLTSRPS